VPRYASQLCNSGYPFSGYGAAFFPFADSWGLDAKARGKCYLGHAVQSAVGGERMFLRFHGDNNSTTEIKKQVNCFRIHRI